MLYDVVNGIFDLRKLSAVWKENNSCNVNLVIDGTVRTVYYGATEDRDNFYDKLVAKWKEVVCQERTL